MHIEHALLLCRCCRQTYKDLQYSLVVFCRSRCSSLHLQTPPPACNIILPPDNNCLRKMRDWAEFNSLSSSKKTVGLKKAIECVQDPLQIWLHIIWMMQIKINGFKHPGWQMRLSFCVNQVSVDENNDESLWRQMYIQVGTSLFLRVRILIVYFTMLN